MFRFKQFTIRQDRAAMKVCTDACILGAYADVAKGLPARILDIGTGTGLLALMAAQRNVGAIVDAIEVDQDASEQAMENVAASILGERPAADRVRIIQ
ncbi:MAG TPA: methyltransferase, partial [Hymenobacter sp.]|nr:methyltransferase [Hymenobacter sp.]